MAGNQKYKVLLLVAVVETLLNITNANIIKLENSTHIYCIDEDGNSTIFVYPPLQISQTDTKLPINVKWYSNDWKTKNATDLPMAAITDKRWRDFLLQKTKTLQFKLSSSIAVSVFGPLTIDMFATEENGYGIRKKLKITEQNTWSHFSVISKNGYVFYYKDYEIIASAKIDKVVDVMFRSNIQTYWKVHDYNFKWSSKTTHSEPTTVEIPATSKSCIFLYTSLCTECFLEVNFNKGTKIISRQSQFLTLMEFWQTNTIKIDPNNKNKITIYRRKHGSSTNDEHWALDIRLCDTNNIASYKINSYQRTEYVNYTCSNLNKHQYTKPSSISSCSSGHFGTNCQFSCKEILEPEFCKNHVLCYQSYCSNITNTQIEKDHEENNQEEIEFNKRSVIMLYLIIITFAFIAWIIIICFSKCEIKEVKIH